MGLVNRADYLCRVARPEVTSRREAKKTLGGENSKRNPRERTPKKEEPSWKVRSVIMAGKFKSLGLAGARKAGSKAMRKLFGQESQPANGGSCDVQTSAGGNNSKSPSELQTEPDLSPDKRVTAHSEQKPNHTTANRGDSNHIINPTTADTDVKSADPQQRDISPAPLDASIAVSSTSTSDDMALRNLQQQDQQQRQTLRQVESPASDAGKENQPPLPPVGSVDNIANHIRNLALLDDAEYISDVKLPTPDPTTLVAEKLSPEQARHLFFVEEALDMVSRLNSVWRLFTTVAQLKAQIVCYLSTLCSDAYQYIAGTTRTQNKRNPGRMCSRSQGQGHLSRHECNKCDPKWHKTRGVHGFIRTSLLPSKGWATINLSQTQDRLQHTVRS